MTATVSNLLFAWRSETVIGDGIRNMNEFGYHNHKAVHLDTKSMCVYLGVYNI